MEHKGKLYPSLALGTLRKVLGVNNDFLIRGKGRTFDDVSAADILSGRTPGGKIQGIEELDLLPNCLEDLRGRFH